MPIIPNGIGIVILDTAQLDPDYVVDLVNRLDMAQVTIVDATHPKEAFNLGVRLLSTRPQMDVFYRRWRNNLPDERMPFMVRPDEFINYMRDVMEAGMIACTYNESQQSPMTPLTTFCKKIIELTAPHNWRTSHFSTSTGTPVGYNNELPDSYAESDDLWRTMAAVNAPRLADGLKPLAHALPHAYFPPWGLQSGHTNRPREIVRRLGQISPKIDPRFIPISIGETGIQIMDASGHISDSEAGFLGVMPPDLYANVYAKVYASAFKSLNAVGQLFSLGDKHPGNSQWHKFDLYKNEPFWKTLENLAKTGVFRLNYWYGDKYTPTPIPDQPNPPSGNPPPIPDPPPVVIPPVAEKVKWSITFTAHYSGTIAQRESTKEAFAGLATFIKTKMTPDELTPDVISVETDQ